MKFFYHVQIAELKASYDKSLAEKEELSQNIQTTADRLKRASKLTTALADEQIRWAESVEVCPSYYKSITVNYSNCRCMIKKLAMSLVMSS